MHSPERSLGVAMHPAPDEVSSAVGEEKSFETANRAAAAQHPIIPSLFEPFIFCLFSFDETFGPVGIANNDIAGCNWCEGISPKRDAREFYRRVRVAKEMLRRRTKRWPCKARPPGHRR